MYVVHFDDYEISDAPFLDLPWDYAADGKNFEDAALRISAYFDHEYPLLSTGLKEGTNEQSKMLISYSSIISEDLPYSSHDGYDWARSAGAIHLDPVLASAAGWASIRGR